MAALIAIVLAVCSLKHIECFGIDSSDAGRIENGAYGPVYDALLFNDIAEILSELDGNGHTPLDALLNSDSESDENVDDLLSEYQHFLEKAHKQRKYYLEKNNSKNKVPLYRHDAYVKNKSGAPAKYDDHYPNNMYKSSVIKFPQSFYNSPLEFLIPINAKSNYYNNVEISTDPASRNIKNIKNSGLRQMQSHQIRADFPPLIPLDITTGNQYENQKLFTPEQKHTEQVFPIFDQPDRSNNDAENALNIKIKLEIQAPKFLGTPGSHHCRNHSQGRAWENTDNMESAPSTLSLPYPYYNFPMPMPMLSMKAPNKGNKLDGAQYHKIVIHKKKKSRPSSASKKHRKKLISFHDVKLDPRLQAPTIFVQAFAAPSFNNLNNTNMTEDSLTNLTLKIPKPHVIIIETNKTLHTTSERITTIQSQTDEVFYVSKNITIHENLTDDTAKIENSIEIDDLKLNSSGVKYKNNIRKRSAVFPLDHLFNTSNITTRSTKKPKENMEELKKVERISFTDPELLYWPNTNASNARTVSKKNITVLILEREHSKAKVNISKESIRINPKTALEKAIFGEVNWDDVDTVAPVFMSFVGKYIRGVLTFCSPTICHSMRCAQKECFHRICAPSDRPNNNGHCVGSNRTDSVASMESIMDLPSNVAFEIVDILQDNMLGKMFGKVTLCISPKCITFASAKKSFLKRKCSIKDLNLTGHCQNVKNLKNL